jgi:formate dehydrogenase maturation protein FdhE
LKEISKVIQKREDLAEYLELKKKILLAQVEDEITAGKAIRSNWITQLSLPLLEKKGLKTKKPIIRFLKTSMFDHSSLMISFKKLTQVFVSINPENARFTTLLKDLNVEDFMKLIHAVLQEDEQPIINTAEQFDVESSILLYLLNASIQPFIAQIARNVSVAFYEKWWRTPCPICGQTPQVARLRNRRRYLTCSFCGVDYPSDHFLCVHCQNKDPYTLQYLKNDDEPEFQIDYCTKCKHYLKVINEDELKEPIPRCIEDILTLDLDITAKNAGLLRNA